MFFTGTKTYNTDVFSSSKRTNTYVFSAFKRTKLTYQRHLKLILMNIEIALLILLLVVLFVISITLFAIASRCLLVYLILNDNILFCCVISAASSFPNKRPT